MRIFRRIFYLLGMIVFLFGMPQRAAAQSYVEGISAVLTSTSDSEIDTWSETYITPDIAYYHGAAVSGFLFDNGALIRSGSATEYPFENDASGELTAPIVIGDLYQVESDHYLVAYFIYGYDSYGNPEYWNPGGYLMGDGGSDPSGYGYAPGGGPVYYGSEYLYLGSTVVQMSSAKPYISSISPSAASAGASGTITVSGTDLVDFFTQQTTPAITGSGITFPSVNLQSATQVALNYSVASNATRGDQSLTLATRFGISNAATFHVGDPTPVVQSISPSTWNAGQAYNNVRISGTGFGTNPSVSISSGTGVQISVNPGSTTDNGTTASFIATVTVAVNAPSETVTVQVQSNGYNGSGFLGTNQGQSPVGSNIVTVQPVPAPVPRILYGGTDVTNNGNNPQTVYAGQQIYLSTSVNMPSGTFMSSQEWSSQGSPIGGYVASTASANLVAPSLGGPATSFYWTNAGSSGHVQYSVEFSYCLNTGSANCASSTATFDVLGPSNASITTTPGTVNVWPAGVANHSTNPWLEYGVAQIDNTGMWFDVSENTTLPNSNQGSFSWVQLITSNTQIVVTGSNGVPTTYVLTPGLDKDYPYAGQYDTDIATDSPGAELLASANSQTSETFHAAMYLMWTPDEAEECQGTSSPCVVPVPLEM